MNNQRIKNKLHSIGIYPMVGVQGPKGEKGDNLKILGTYNSYDELIREHPTGIGGDCYLVNGILYFWNENIRSFENGGSIVGPTGPSEGISIEGTITAEPGTKAIVKDNFDGLVHNLSFIIPKGEPGKEISNPTSYDSILFVSFAQANFSKIMTFQEIVAIPDDNDYFKLNDDTNITIVNKGIYEITLCGQISGVDQSHGAIFYLTNTNGSVIQDLSFEVKAGTTSRMDCSETILTKFDDNTTLYIRCGITGDSSTANIDFTNVNLIVKKYHVTI